jgi:nucleotide-binding universal stress UspA family protein
MTIDLIVMGTTGSGSMINKLFGSNASKVLRYANKPVLVIPPQCRYVHPEKICLSTDFKFDNMASLSLMTSIAKIFNSHIDILYVNNDKEELIEAKQMKLSKELDEHLKDFKREFHFIDNNRIEDGVNDFIDQKQPQLLCMIIKNYGFLESLFHKSVTKEMAMSGKIPLLTLK